MFNTGFKMCQVHGDANDDDDNEDDDEDGGGEFRTTTSCWSGLQ